ncbi:MAG TPA: hypothetical protein VGA96_01995 [Fibrella sp.]
MKFTLIVSLFVLLASRNYAQTTLFQQDFSSSTSIASYISSTPGTDKFNGLSGPSATIVNGTLQFNRTTNGTTGGFAHSTDLSPASNSLYIQLDFEVVSTTAVAGSSALVFYVGSGFTSSPTSPDVADQYARFGIGFTNTGGQFTVRYIGPGGAGSVSSSPFTGKQTLTFVLNNTGSIVTYLQPGGGTQTLANDTYDLWVGTTEVFNGRAVLTPTQSTTDFKLRIDDDVYAAAFQFDNIIIRDINGALPVSVANIKAVATSSQVNLSWQFLQQSAALFTVERSPDAREFIAIGSLKADGNLNEQRTYNFTDYLPGTGTNYYRLRQADADGSESFSKIVAAEVLTNVPDFTILDISGAGTSISVYPKNIPGATYLLTTLTGQLVTCQQRKTPDGEVTLLPQRPLPSGVYLLTAYTETTKVTRRLQVR